MKDKNINQFCLKESATVRECMGVIDKNKQGIALIVDTKGRLTGTVTDGDIRRFLLAGSSLDEPVTDVMWTKPLTAPHGTSEKELKELMNKHLIRNIPILDRNGCPAKIVHLRDIISELDAYQSAVIMAGGKGKRLRPVTENIPKPMIKVGNKPILENIINYLKESGIVNIYISLNYKTEMIEDYFKDGSQYGVNISYLKEKKELGTAGALTLLPEIPSSPLLVINGDVITKTNFLRLIEFHKLHRCVMTVAATQYTLNIPFGVLNISSHYLLGIEEKPEQRFLCNAGIYMLNPEALSLIPANTAFDMTDLIKELVRKGLPVTTFPIHEYWVDIGQMEDLRKAQNELKEF
jgi:dTDP-glucose pyrophosphorylase